MNRRLAGRPPDELTMLPVARHRDVVPAAEDRSYLLFIAAALIVALLAGFSLGVLLPLVARGTIPWMSRYSQLVQAHGWAQLHGWAGLFVAGMALRLVPRFAGRRPLPVQVAVPLLLLLTMGLVLRTLGQPTAGDVPGDAALLVGTVSGAAGTAGVAAALAVTLYLGRRRPEPWRYFAWAGVGWWLAWAGLTVAAGLRALEYGGIVPATLDEPSTWLVLLGALGNFIWMVQSRSVPIFFGRPPPSVRGLALPWLLLNGGLLAMLLAVVAPSELDWKRLESAGLAAAGLATGWLALVAGAVYGRPHRLRPRARAAARFVVAANRWAVLAAALLLWVGLEAVTGDSVPFGTRDAARHALGLGLITMLIVGMAGLVAPLFALERAESQPPGIEYRLGYPALMTAASLRVLAGLLTDHIDGGLRLDLIAAAGVLAWLGVASFTWSVLRAWRKEPRMKAVLAARVGPGAVSSYPSARRGRGGTDGG